MAGEVAGDSVHRTQELLQLVHEVVGISVKGGIFKKDCTDLVRRVALLTHLFEEIRETKGTQFESLNVATSCSLSSCSRGSWEFDLAVALKASKRLLFVVAKFHSSNGPPDEATRKIPFIFQSVTSKLEKSLGNFPYDQFHISSEVQEQVELLRRQLKRATERYGSVNSKMLPHALSKPLEKEIQRVSQKLVNNLHTKNVSSSNQEHTEKSNTALKSEALKCSSRQRLIQKSEMMYNSSASQLCDADKQVNPPSKGLDENKKSDAIVIPDDFLCPISLELMRDPVIVATGQTYERSCIQRWIDCGNKTCPKTQQELDHLTLTPNYVIRSLINQWCLEHNIEQQTRLTNGKMKKCDGSFFDVSGDIAAIEVLVRKLSS